ncbi:tripartite tricarboxylate transporter substrate binding protein [Pusillimonas sp. TS35]|uniref:Bug family tripartite tricarboxylate transporter substrate binding protein n=1 Tax=Paracandidimonas lactea TaxID=2895524 RepID=UPI00136A7D12|nr:tripartite tricarboxylate transporter substrate binding protein [Paracandidimonas lactea]MYN13150.1 tripartite tricarboxylate transporter substrate binding protein [Pusillimonas sp. TS35]
MKGFIKKFLPAIALASFALPVAAAYPDKPIKLVVPYAAGGPTDTFARVLADVWGQKIGGTFIVENKAGAGTVIGTDYVAQAPNDGYTVLMSTVAHAVSPSLHKKLNFDPVKDFSSVGLAAKAPLVLVVNKDLPVQNLKEFMAYIKANAEKTDYGSAGIGSAPHLGGALLNHMGKFKVRHIPYKGSAPAMADLIGGHVQFMMDSAPTGLAQANAGTVRLIATSMQERLPQTPDTPAIAELLPGYEAYTWNAMLVRAGTDAKVINTLRASLEQALHDKGLKAKADQMGLMLEQKPDPKALDMFIAEEIKKWSTVVGASDMRSN